MARKVRIEYQGAIYHVMSRGNRREKICLVDRDRTEFQRALAEVCARTDWQIHAWVIMPNHFHLLVETPRANLVAGMKWLLGTYTMRFNRRHGLTGHLFAGRYKALPVDPVEGNYLRTVADYIHLNPAKAKLIESEQLLKIYPWSSWPLYLSPSSSRPTWLRVDRVMGEHAISRDTCRARRELEKRLEHRRKCADFPQAESGWFWGGHEFRRSLLKKISQQAGAEHYGPEISESAADKANHIACACLHRMHLSEDQLVLLPKSEPRKVEIAMQLKAETEMSSAWIARRLAMGSRSYVDHLLWRARKTSINKN